jgi:NADH dehydrogenase
MTGWRRRDRVAGGGPRVVVAGAGFAGLATLRGLAAIGARTLLVDRNVYSTFQPLLYQVATGGLAPSDVAYPIRSLVRRYRARYRHGELAGLDPDARRVRLADGAEIEYDYLILATGVSAAYYGVTGAAEHTVGLYTRRDAIALRNGFNDRLEHLAADGLAKGFTVTIVGGGATGVELAGTMAEVRNIAMPALFPDIDLSGVHIRLVEMGDALLAPFRPSLQRYARRQMLRRGVEVMLGTAISRVHQDHIVLASGEELASDLTVWAAGVAGPAEDRGFGLPLGRGGRIVTGPDLRVDGHDRIFAVGDIGLISASPLPQLAQPALQTGRHAAAQIARLEAGQPTEPFRYHDKGIMATIGRSSAVVQLASGIRFGGFPAWVAWLGLHLVYLLGTRNRVSTLLNLAYRYVSWGSGGGFIVGDDPSMPSPAAATARARGAVG